jgi:hypothetical protein
VKPLSHAQQKLIQSQQVLRGRRHSGISQQVAGERHEGHGMRWPTMCQADPRVRGSLIRKRSSTSANAPFFFVSSVQDHIRAKKLEDLQMEPQTCGKPRQEKAWQVEPCEGECKRRDYPRRSPGTELTPTTPCALQPVIRCRGTNQSSFILPITSN